MLTANEIDNVRKREDRKGVHPVKVTALAYLREALAEERYEEMKEFVEIAREFGADSHEVALALAAAKN